MATKKEPKPPKNLDRLTAGDFTKGGKKIKFRYLEETIECIEFTSAKQCQDSIIRGLKRSNSISQAAYEVLEQYIASGKWGKFDWGENVSHKEKNKLGVYLGEILFGMLCLADKTTGIISPKPYSGKIARLLLPVSDRFVGLDSIMEKSDGEIIPISSKYGKGSPASFFGNILIKGMENYQHVPKSVFRDIIDMSKAIGVTPQHIAKKQKSKEIVYEYGIRKILGLDRRRIKETYDVFEDIKKNRETKQRDLVIEKMQLLEPMDNRVLENLDDSLTWFFSKTMAERLMKDKRSVDEIKEILSGKNFWQVNLHDADWQKGIVHFRCLKSRNANLQIVGNQSSIDDLDCKHGTLNYVLKF